MEDLATAMARSDAEVSALRDYVEALDDLEDEAAELHWVQDIKPGLGQVKVDGRGRVVAVELDIHTVRLSDRSLLAERVLQAFNAANARRVADLAERAAVKIW
ncbi:YbaB/EbfC family nucleoid-associated protein [Actinomadura rugatobispora]|uniref:YbaB/EbfC family nucleoid-associated protein n=1 Tax=Actinomadura rugatobispora TaxID=1994 RepID=A0ABW1AAD2_9ACTN